MYVYIFSFLAIQFNLTITSHICYSLGLIQTQVNSYIYVCTILYIAPYDDADKIFVITALTQYQVLATVLYSIRARAQYSKLAIVFCMHTEYYKVYGAI